MSEITHRIRSFVNRQGRMSQLQKKGYEENYKQFVIPYSVNSVIHIEDVFSNKNPVIIEIGFGMGDATIQIAQANPNINYIGIEVHKPGIGKLLSEIEKNILTNIRIIDFDAVEVLEHMIPEKSIAGFHIFFPDPWPKTKHRKRRLINTGFLNLVSHKLIKNGYLFIATDWEEYATFILNELANCKGLINPHNGFAPPVTWRPNTKFEKKGYEKQHIIREVWVYNK